MMVPDVTVPLPRRTSFSTRCNARWIYWASADFLSSPGSVIAMVRMFAMAQNSDADKNAETVADALIFVRLALTPINAGLFATNCDTRDDPGPAVDAALSDSPESAMTMSYATIGALVHESSLARQYLCSSTRPISQAMWVRKVLRSCSSPTSSGVSERTWMPRSMPSPSVSQYSDAVTAEPPPEATSLNCSTGT